MRYLCEGALVARMAEMVARRRLTQDTAAALLDEMIADLSLPGADFNNQENFPGHPLGDLIAEAFADGASFPVLKATNPWTIDHSDGHTIPSDAQLDGQLKAYRVALNRFRQRYGI